MDLVLVGCPGAARPPRVGGLPAARRRAFIDLDEAHRRRRRRPIPAIFDEEGEPASAPASGAAVPAGPADAAPDLRR